MRVAISLTGKRGYNAGRDGLGKKLDLNIIGLMCLPPKNKDNTDYFSKMKELASKIGVEQLSMGMSADYIQASNLGSTFIRVGSNIFGERFKKF